VFTILSHAMMLQPVNDTDAMFPDASAVAKSISAPKTIE